jgi:hypothetical protein
MGLYEYRVTVIELERSGKRWRRRGLVAQHLQQGWSVDGVAPSGQNMLVFLKKKVWFWQREQIKHANKLISSDRENEQTDADLTRNPQLAPL